jgi:hypothetical protein
VAWPSAVDRNCPQRRRCYVKGHKQRAKDLDAICAASAMVAKRLREEALE